MNTKDKNILIAEFMGYEKNRGRYFIYERGYIDNQGIWKDYFSDEELEFHESWDWLESVINKIKQIGFDIVINKNIAKKELKFEIMYETVVEFIKKRKNEHKYQSN